jgi:hypothetical protein
MIMKNNDNKIPSWLPLISVTALGLTSLALKNKIMGDSIRNQGLFMPLTDTKNFFKGIGAYKELKALETQRDRAVKSMADLMKAKKNVSAKHPVKSLGALKKQTNKTITEWKTLDEMNTRQQRLHGVEDVGEFGEKLKGGVATSGILGGGATLSGYLEYKKRKPVKAPSNTK